MKEIYSRKDEHIQLSLRDGLVNKAMKDPRFCYEPLFQAHPKEVKKINFLGKEFSAPLWFSSMTGGTKLAEGINKTLAKACREFRLGMSLGSCRILLENPSSFESFNLRPILGPDRPFYGNLGISQLEKMIIDKSYEKIQELILKLDADGLIVHLNPLQEWFQEGGDLLSRPALETLQLALEVFDFPIIVKEVGQGIGPKSLKALVELPFQAIEFSAFGGVNFSKLEIERKKQGDKGSLNEFISRPESLMETSQKSSHLEGHPLVHVGHTAEEMIESLVDLKDSNDKISCQNFIVSGGIKNFLDGYYALSILPRPFKGVYGYASTVLKHAMDGEQSLFRFLNDEINSYAMAESYLSINPRFIKKARN